MRGDVDAPPRRTAWTASELMAAVFPDPKWAVPGLLCEGLNLLAGAPKLGKSWFALNVCVAVAAGGRALGAVQVEQGDCLYLALEDTPRRLQSRLRLVLGDEPAPDRLTVDVECARFPDGASKVAQWLRDHPDARLVVVDVLTKVRPVPDGTVGRYEADYLAVSAMKALADDHGVALLVVHHTRKQESVDYLDSVSGTQGLAGAADAVLVLARSRGSAQAVLKVTGRDIEETDHALDFDASTGLWKLLDGPAEDYLLQDTRRRILQHLRDQDAALQPKTIASALDLNHESVKKTCQRMAGDGQLENDGGRYRLPVSPVPPVPLSLIEGDTGTRGTPDRGPL
ncbi:AAA family ATPase [Dermatobacter hominis]|uniref:AAA family ATPase n=1 Tax=Dermatobacter hominis TaxID=2884263 RepID=UPI001D10C203|nr:AAA family ATPase [Dermatobacter hominis]UDY35689.1 helicase RepA family protein [Dermatobacter hominis]